MIKAEFLRNGVLAVGLTALLIPVMFERATGISNATRLQKVHEMFNHYKKSFPDVPDISADELVEMLEKENIILVDVRDPAEQRVSIIPGAVSKERFEENLPRGGREAVVVYCTIGYRSGLYAEELIEKGVNALNLRGGVLSWAHAGKDFACNGRKTRRVHVYGKQWDLLPEAYESVW